jgi:flagellar motor switch protein FliN/FliY
MEKEKDIYDVIANERKDDDDNLTTELVNLDFFKDIPLGVKVELGKADLSLGELLSLHIGSTIELDKLAGEPLEFFISDRLAARGEVVVLNEKFGIRLTDIIDPKTQKEREL